MNNILNAHEAFNALQKGKTVLCRYAGDGTLHADKDFSTLDQMPATVFALPNYEFCIQVEMLELAGITFTKPLTIEEIEQGQDVFLIQPHAVIQQYKFNENIDELVDGIHAGFAQRDFENAQLQYKAFCEAVGGTPIQVNLEIVEQPKKSEHQKSRMTLMVLSSNLLMLLTMKFHWMTSSVQLVIKNLPQMMLKKDIG